MILKSSLMIFEENQEKNNFYIAKLKNLFYTNVECSIE